MALEPTWQSNYVDLCDGDTVQFGSRCVICGARYASAAERLDPALVRAAVPGSPAAHEVEEFKYRSFTEFDQAFRDLAIECYRCERPACPDCWDEDHRMCGSCVVTRGLTRSPHRGRSGAGPLADGRLRIVEHGQFGDVSRPSWLDDLIATQSSGERPAATPTPRTDTQWMRQLERQNDPPVAHPANGHKPESAYRAGDLGTLALEPTTHLSITSGPATFQAPPPRYPERQPVPPERARDFETPEGRSTSNMVECPRCGTANYDFVTRCTVCQLQLIQNCPLCEKLNPGHVRQCEYCGSPLDRPHGWSDVSNPIVPLSPEAARQRQAAAPVRVTPPPTPAPRKGRTGKVKSVPLGPRRVNAPAPPAVPPVPFPVTDGFDAPVAAASISTAAYAPFEVQPYAEDEPAEEDMLGTILGGIERFVSFVLCVAILCLIVAVVAAELSPQVNAAIRGIIHVDIQISLTRFVDWAQTSWRRIHQ